MQDKRKAYLHRSVHQRLEIVIMVPSIDGEPLTEARILELTRRGPHDGSTIGAVIDWLRSLGLVNRL
jgi:hypothetical protein